MKITLPKDYRKWFTYEDVDRTKKVAEYLKEYDSIPLTEYANYAACTYMEWRGGSVDEILTVSAEFAKNCNLSRNKRYNYYTEDSEDMDVEVKFVARVWWHNVNGRPDGYGIIEAHAMLSDIQQTGVESYAWKMYAHEFVEAKED